MASNPTPITKYATFITQAQEGIEQAIKTRSGEGEPPLVKLLRKLLENDDDDKDTKSE